MTSCYCTRREGYKNISKLIQGGRYDITEKVKPESLQRSLSCRLLYCKALLLQFYTASALMFSQRRTDTDLSFGRV